MDKKGGKGKGKGGGDKGGKGGKGNKEDSSTELKTCNFVKARHILCSKLSVIEDIQKKLTEENGKSVKSSDFAKFAEEFSECSSKNKGGNLGTFDRQTMVGPFAEVAFSLPPGQLSDIVKTVHGYHLILVEERKMSK